MHKNKYMPSFISILIAILAVPARLKPRSAAAQLNSQREAVPTGRCLSPAVLSTPMTSLWKFTAPIMPLHCWT